MIVEKLERYLVVLALAVLAAIGAYFYGRHSEREALEAKQVRADNEQLLKNQAALEARAALDEAARRRAEEFLNLLDRGIDDVRERFAKVPSVVVDARGCYELAASFRLRWNAVEGLPAGGAPARTDDAHRDVPLGDVPAPGRF